MKRSILKIQHIIVLILCMLPVTLQGQDTMSGATTPTPSPYYQDTLVEESKKVTDNDSSSSYYSEPNNDKFVKIIFIALLFFIMQYSFALLLGNSAVLYAKRNGLPLIILFNIMIALAPILHPILNMIRYDHPFLLPEGGWLLFIFLSLLGGVFEAFIYQQFLQKKFEGVSIKQTLKPCENWFLCLFALALLGTLTIIMLVLR